MRLHSVNVGVERAMDNGKPSGKTGIYKLPTTAPVQIHELGLAGDVISDTDNHGGDDQAIYVYGTVDYEWWSAELGQTLEPGTFGENLTITELASATFNIGDRLQVGEVLLEITSPRIPCNTLAVRMNDSHFPKKFMQADRPGFYCRVIETGAVQAGDAVTVIPYTGATVSVIAVQNAFYAKDLSADDLQRLLAAPLARRAREYYANKLAKLTV